MGTTILVVDDDPDIVSMLSVRLTRRGHRVLTAADGVEGLEVARRERPAVIILDVMMPRRTGWEVARALKQDPVTDRIRVIMLSAIGEQINAMTSPLYGADAHLDKPFEFAALEALIDQLTR